MEFDTTWRSDRAADAYITPIGAESTSEHPNQRATQRASNPTSEQPMAFKANYGRDRAERARAARTRSEEKQRKKDEKTEQRKAKRAEINPDESNPPPDETQTSDETQTPDETQS